MKQSKVSIAVSGADATAIARLTEILTELLHRIERTQSPRYASTNRKLTPPQIARKFGVDVKKVHCWIRSGELKAMNGAQTRNGRPRWLVDVNDLADFEKSRSNHEPVLVKRKRHLGNGRFDYTTATRKRARINPDVDSRYAKNIPHEYRVRKSAMAIRQRLNEDGRSHGRWEDCLDDAIERYYKRHGIRVKAQDVLELPDAGWSHL